MVTIEKATMNIALVCKRCYPSVSAWKLELYTYSSTGTCSKIKNLFVTDIINKNIRDLKTAFGIGDIIIKSY